MASVEEIGDHIALINQSRKILDGPVNEIKQTYKSHIFELEFLGNLQLLKLPPSIRVLESEQNGETGKILIQQQDNMTNNDLLKIFMNETEVLSFREIIPSMNEVFIQVVEQYNQKSLIHEQITAHTQTRIPNPGQKKIVYNHDPAGSVYDGAFYRSAHLPFDNG
jgi:ABC-2 type transport system ATP-binding protein